MLEFQPIQMLQMALVVSRALKYEGLKRRSAMCKPLFSSRRLRQGARADGVARGLKKAR